MTVWGIREYRPLKYPTTENSKTCQVHGETDAKVVGVGEGFPQKAGPLFANFSDLRAAIWRQNLELDVATNAECADGAFDTQGDFAVRVLDRKLRSAK